MGDRSVHPCVRCGACCATFRVLFDAAEMRPDSFHVPKEWTEKVEGDTRAMLGTNDPKPRCAALAGRIGHEVGCSVYERRPGCCREFKPSYEDGRPNARCDWARKGKGLRPLRASDYHQSTPTHQDLGPDKPAGEVTVLSTAPTS